MKTLNDEYWVGPDATAVKIYVVRADLRMLTDSLVIEQSEDPCILKHSNSNERICQDSNESLEEGRGSSRTFEKVEEVRERSRRSRKFEKAREGRESSRTFEKDLHNSALVRPLKELLV